MEIVLYFLPFLISIVLLIFFKKHIVWWEYIVLIVPSVLFTLVVREAFIWGKTEDTEYWGGYAVKIRHYDEWDEWIDRTCTRMVAVGTDKEGNTIYEEEEYDCSYRQYHPEYWVYKNNITQHEVPISKELFEKIRKQFNTKMVFVDMHRNYYRIDGDAQDYFYDGTISHLRALTKEHTYKNKILVSQSIFNFEKISREEAEKEGLFEYPKIEDNDQQVILGLKLGKALEKKYKYINSMYGKEKQFRIYVLIFKDKPFAVSELQKSYWQGGNKNEFVLCLGYNTKKKTIDWCNPFSWSDNPKLEVTTKRYFREHNHVRDLWLYPNWLKTHLGLWKRKNFADFEYIDNTLTNGQSVWLFILILLFNVFTSIFLLGNEFSYENQY